jgi:hypothetical protein
MTCRLIDVLCTAHRAMILNTGLWPHGFRPDECPACGDSRTVRILPGVGEGTELPIHEAGHTVAYLWGGVEVTEVTLKPSATLSAATSFRSFDLSSLPELTGLWAGMEAARELLRRLDRLDDAGAVDIAVGGRTDASLITGATSDLDMIAEAREVARRVVRRQWDRVSLVASALLRAETLSAADLDQVIWPS